MAKTKMRVPTKVNAENKPKSFRAADFTNNKLRKAPTVVILPTIIGKEMSLIVLDNDWVSL